MSGNRGVVFTGPGKGEVQNIAFPELSDPSGRKANHGVILRVVATNICGSDQHMVRGRTTAPSGYAAFDSGVPRKFVIDPHASLKAAACASR